MVLLQLLSDVLLFPVVVYEEAKKEEWKPLLLTAVVGAVLLSQTLPIGSQNMLVYGGVAYVVAGVVVVVDKWLLTGSA